MPVRTDSILPSSSVLTSDGPNGSSTLPLNAFPRAQEPCSKSDGAIYLLCSSSHNCKEEHERAHGKSEILISSCRALGLPGTSRAFESGISSAGSSDEQQKLLHARRWPVSCVRCNHERCCGESMMCTYNHLNRLISGLQSTGQGHGELKT